MFLLPLLLVTAIAVGPDDPEPYNGRLGQLNVRMPKFTGEISVDGSLDEAVWSKSAMLTGFSQFTPVDGVAASDSTEVLLWYSERAMHIGIRAFDKAGDVRTQLAQRDRIASDDNIQIFLSTFNDGRQATFLAVNPLGVQSDGAVNEAGGRNCNGFNCATSTREGPDLSQNFVWQSAGRITDWGYEVEIVLPFKSIRFQSAKVQDWGINILRVVQRSGQEQSWTPAKVGQSSFLAQSGKLVGLEGLKTGRAIDLIPTFTSSVNGAPSSKTGNGWEYQGGQPEVGGNLRWGITSNLTLNATANPDFSQVESDVGQFSFDPRQAINFPERRPFFLEGVEQFQAPGNLIYTRKIVQPVAATKLTGKAGGTQIGVILALDDRAASITGDNNPFFGVLRLARDLGPGSRIGGVFTQQADGKVNNRVFGMDGRFVLGGIHSFTFRGALARDEVDGTSTTAPSWGLGYRRNGRGFRSNYSVGGTHRNFITRTGFVSRPDFGSAQIAHSYTWLRPERTLESITAEIQFNGTWAYDSLVSFAGIQDRKFALNVNTTLKGGWGVGASWLEETFGYDPSIYTNYGVLQPNGSVDPFVGTPRIPNRDAVLSLSSPQFSWGSFNIFSLFGHDENYPEWASGYLVVFNAGVTLRPSNKLRINLTYNRTTVNRRSDGSQVSLQVVPRARVEYQLSRAFQVRIISQFPINERDSLRDESRTGLPIVISDGQGNWNPTVPFRNASLRTDLLFTYLPNPGTVVYLGYGTSHREEDPFGRRRLERTNDGFFVKLSYLFRMR